MNYSVNLVQHGISSSTHPVSGKSGKVYGQAVQGHGGVSFLMTLADYTDNMHDLIGNPAPNQQWVPEFVAIQSPGAHKCDRCPKPAVAQWDKFYFCLDHAPRNATFLDGSGLVAPAAAKKPSQDAADTRPVVQERLSKPIEEEKELSTEHMAAPPIGTEREGDPPTKTEAGVITLKEQQPPGPKGPLGPQLGKLHEPEPAPEKAPDGAQKVVAAITQGVIEAVLPKIDQLLDAKLAARRVVGKQPNKPAKQPKQPTEFQQLQARAKELGINTFGKSAKKIQTEIAKAAGG